MESIRLLLVVVCLNRLIDCQENDQRCQNTGNNLEYDIDAAISYWDRGYDKPSAEYAVFTKTGKVYVTEYEPIITSRHRLRLFVHKTKSYDSVIKYLRSQLGCTNDINEKWNTNISSGYVKNHFKRSIFLNRNMDETGNHERFIVQSKQTQIPPIYWYTRCSVSSNIVNYQVKSTIYRGNKTIGFTINDQKFINNGTHAYITERVHLAPDAMLKVSRKDATNKEYSWR